MSLLETFICQVFHKLILFVNSDPPYWICHFESCRFDPIFIISDLENRSAWIFTLLFTTDHTKLHSLPKECHFHVFCLFPAFLQLTNFICWNHSYVFSIPNHAAKSECSMNCACIIIRPSERPFSVLRAQFKFYECRATERTETRNSVLVRFSSADTIGTCRKYRYNTECICGDACFPASSSSARHSWRSAAAVPAWASCGLSACLGFWSWCDSCQICDDSSSWCCAPWITLPYSFLF